MRFAIAWLSLSLLLPATFAPARADNGISEDFVVAKVTRVSRSKVNDQLLKSTGIVTGKELVEVEITEGQLKGSKVVVPNEITDNPAFNVEAEPGKEVVLSVVRQNNKAAEFNIADYHRVPVLAFLLCAFLAVFLFFGGKRGLKSLIGLAIGIVLIGTVLLPLSLHGVDPLLTASLLCIVVTATTSTLVAGWSRKALSAVLGTIGGVIIAGLSAQIVICAAPLTGLSTEEAQILRGSFVAQPPHFFTGLLAAGMLIGALGVIMDVAVSIASAVAEVADTDQSLTAAALYRKGMNVGRDIMGTMTSTLVLAYTGSALPLLLLMAQIPSTKLLNLDLVATEVASALTGSLGLICTIPLTALAASRLLCSAQTRGTRQSQRPARSNMNRAEAEFEEQLFSSTSPK